MKGEKFSAEMDKQKFCPLCQRKWKIVEDMDPKGRAYFACFFCEISIWIRDKMIGKWDAFEKVPCTVCGTEMRFFCRSDMYAKFWCPKCGASVESVDPEKHRKINNDAETKDIFI